MKKLLLSLFISGACIYASAQPTFDFESWTGTGANIEPKGWVSANELINPFFPGNIQSVFQETTLAKVHGGTSSLRIETVKINNNPLAASIPDPMGAAFPGSVVLIPTAKIVEGFQYAGRPTIADFWYLYQPVAADSASCYIMLTKWNGTKRDTIAEGGMVIKSAATSYTQGTVNISYDPNFDTEVSDTMHIVFTATCYASLKCGTIGSILWVDDVTFSGWNGINEHPSSEGVILYPNPVTQLLNIAIDGVEASKVMVYDATGRIIASSSLSLLNNGMNRRACTIDTYVLSSGLYSYSLGDKEGNIIRSGKFNVVK